MYKSSVIFKYSIHNLCSLLFLIVASTNCKAQSYYLSGKLTDMTGAPIKYASVTLTRFSDSTIINGNSTDSLGEFRFQQIRGSYVLQVKAIGFQTTRKKVDLTADIDLGSIPLAANIVKMQEVAIFASRPVVRREIDRLIFDVGNAVSSHGANALELLQEVPGLRATNDDISVIGKGELKVYINDRETKLSGSALLDLLKSYSASEISKVEIITTPPARYEAAGNAGIVNIVLKRKPQNYLGGNVSLTESYQKYRSIDASRASSIVNMTLNRSKTSSFLNVNYTGGKTGYQENNSIYYPTQIWENANTVRNPTNLLNLRAGVDYILNNKYTIGVQGGYNTDSGNSEENYESNIFAFNLTLPDSLISSRASRDRSNRRYNINFHIDRKIDTIGKKITFDFDYLYNRINTDEIFLSNTFNAMNQLAVESQYSYLRDQLSLLDAISSSLDFLLPYKNLSINAGVKFSYTENQYHIHHYNDTSLGDIIDNFDYNEEITAIYFDLNKNLTKKLQFKAGLRLENTSTKSFSKSENQRDNNNYLRLFPTVYFSWRPIKDHVFNLNFSNRISRPYYNMVNPFRTYANQYTYVEGKSDLKPYYTYNTEIGYTYKDNFNLSGFYSFADNVFDQAVTIEQETKVTGLKWNNFINRRNFGLTNSYSLSVPHWLKVYCQHGVNYAENKSSYPVNPGVKGWVYYAEVRNTIYFDKGKNINGSLAGSYTSKQYLSNVTLRPNFLLNAGMRYSFLKKKVNASLYVTNLFNFSAARGETRSNDIVMKIKNYYSPSTFRLTLSYNFGAELSAKARNYSNTDIQRRL